MARTVEPNGCRIAPLRAGGRLTSRNWRRPTWRRCAPSGSSSGSDRISRNTRSHRSLNQTTPTPIAAKPAALPAPPQLLRISVLLSPRATPDETARARGLMQSVRQESRLRSGTVWRGQISAGQLSGLAQSDAVLWIEPVPRHEALRRGLLQDRRGRWRPERPADAVAGLRRRGRDGRGGRQRPGQRRRRDDAPGLAGPHPGVLLLRHSLDGRGGRAQPRHARAPASSPATARRARWTRTARSTAWAWRRAPASSRSASSTAMGNYEPPPSFRDADARRQTRRARTSARTVGATTRRAATT